MFTCPANHTSETPEFCSVCGLEIPGAQPTAASPPAPAAVADMVPVAAFPAGGEVCPDCGALRDNDRQVFCEVCGYNFATRMAGSGPPPYMQAAAANGPLSEPAKVPPTSAVVEDPPPLEADAPTPAAATAPGVPAAGGDARWDLVVTVNANLYGSPNPDAPLGQPPRTFRLFDRETMIGRAGTEVRVQVPVQGDPGVSRRQVLLIQGPDGSLLLRDLNSSNGTRVDGVDVLPGVDTVLHDGAVVAIGAWTSIVVRAIGG